MDVEVSSMMAVSAVCAQGLHTSLGRAWLERDVASSGSVGCCGIVRDCQHLECPEEVAARRALLLPH